MQKADVLLIRAISQTKQSCAIDMSARMVVWNHSLFKIVSFFFLFIYLIFFFNSTTNFLINWIACQMGRERGEGFWASSPRDLSNAPTTWSTTPARTRGACKGSFFHSSVLPPLEVIKIKSCVKRPQVGVLRVAQCYRWDRDGRADLFCMRKRGEKLSAKICIATQNKKKTNKKKLSQEHVT